MATSSTDHADKDSLFGSPISSQAALEPGESPEIKDVAASTGTAVTTEQPCPRLTATGETEPAPEAEAKPCPAEQSEAATAKDHSNIGFTEQLNSFEGLELPKQQLQEEEVHRLVEGVIADCDTEPRATLNQPAPMDIFKSSKTNQDSAAKIDDMLIDPQLIDPQLIDPHLMQSGDFALEFFNHAAPGSFSNKDIAPSHSDIPQNPVSPDAAGMTKENPSVGAGLARKQLQWFEAEDNGSIKKSCKKRNIDKSRGGDEDSDEECDKMVYQSHPRPAAWGPANSTQPMFRYSTRGQWSVGTYYTTEELRFYVANCPRNFTVWVQSIPNSNRRQDLWDRICRWSECPDQGYPVAPGFYRCTFDEYSHLTSNEKKDPYFVAGCVHLYCFEKIFDAAKLHRRGRLMPDLRVLEARGNPMALDRHPDKGVEEDAWIPWMEQQPDGNAVPSRNWVPQPHEQTLGYALTKYHANQLGKRANGGGGQAASERQRTRAKPLAEHLGDLQAFVDSAGKDRHRRRKDLTASAAVGPSPASADSDSESVDEPDTDEDVKEESDIEEEEEDSEENSEDDSDAEIEAYEIEEFRAQRKRHGQTQYQIKWKGHVETSWEPASSLKRDLSRREFNEFLSAMPKTTKAAHKATKEKAGVTKSHKIKSLEAQVERLIKMVGDRKRSGSKRKFKRVREPSTEDGDSDDEVIVVKRQRTNQRQPPLTDDLERELTNAEKKSNGKRTCVAGNVPKNRARDSRSIAMAESDEDGSEPEYRPSKHRRHSKVRSLVKTAVGKRSHRAAYSRRLAEPASEEEESELSEDETPSRKRNRLAK